MFKTKKQAKKLIFASEIALKVQRSDPAQNPYVPADFLSARLQCSRLLHHCGKFLQLNGRPLRLELLKKRTHARHSVSSQLVKYNIIGATIFMTFRTQIHTKKFGKNGFRNLQGTMSHRPLTNTSSLKITAAQWTYMEHTSKYLKQLSHKKVTETGGFQQNC